MRKNKANIYILRQESLEAMITGDWGRLADVSGVALLYWRRHLQPQKASNVLDFPLKLRRLPRCQPKGLFSFPGMTRFATKRAQTSQIKDKGGFVSVGSSDRLTR